MHMVLGFKKRFGEVGKYGVGGMTSNKDPLNISIIFGEINMVPELF